MSRNRWKFVLTLDTVLPDLERFGDVLKVAMKIDVNKERLSQKFLREKHQN